MSAASRLVRRRLSVPILRAELHRTSPMAVMEEGAAIAIPAVPGGYHRRNCNESTVNNEDDIHDSWNIAIGSERLNRHEEDKQLRQSSLRTVATGDDGEGEAHGGQCAQGYVHECAVQL
jgi:hypothetical protein